MTLLIRLDALCRARVVCHTEITMPILAIVLTTGLTIAPQQPVVTGSIAGCASDTVSQQLPGTTVLATGGAVQRTARVDSTGCYELKDLPSGSYRVTATLAGFMFVTRGCGDWAVFGPDRPTGAMRATQ